MMMRVKFNKFERVAGLFVLVAIVGCFLSMVGVAVKQGWFESKTTFTTVFESAEGLHSGTPVLMSGLRVGAVDTVELRPDNRIGVEFKVFSKFASKIRQDSEAQLVRPFIIGERILEITVGSAESAELEAGAVIRSTEAVDLMTLMSGRKLGVALGEMGGMVENLRFLAEAFLDKDRTAGLVKIFDRIDPLLVNLNSMSVEVVKLAKQGTKDERFANVLKELAVTTKELNAMLPDLKRRAPKMADDLEQLVSNLAVLTESSKVLMPALAEIAPDLPRSSRRAVEALDEAVVLLKAMQKSWMLRGSANEVREEEAKRDRKPANVSP